MTFSTDNFLFTIYRNTFTHCKVINIHVAAQTVRKNIFLILPTFLFLTLTSDEIFPCHKGLSKICTPHHALQIPSSSHLVGCLLMPLVWPQASSSPTLTTLRTRVTTPSAFFNSFTFFVLVGRSFFMLRGGRKKSGVQ